MPCSAGRGSFLALLGAGHAGGARVHHGCGPWPGSVALALGARSHSIWHVITGSLSDPPSQARSWKPPKCHLFYFVFRSAAVLATSTTPALKTCTRHTLTQPWYNSSRASSFSPRDSREQLLCVCVSVYVCAVEPRILQQAVRGGYNYRRRNKERYN